MAKQNCWEYLGCNRQPGGSKVGELGECPAATFLPTDGFCSGKNAGRACMFTVGMLCTGSLQGTQQDNKKDCLGCNFYKLVQKEEGIEAISIFAFRKHITGK